MQATGTRSKRNNGSILMVSVIFLAIASLAVISILIATGNYTRISFDAHEYERAFELADAGVRAAVLDLNSGRSGTIDAARARTFFAGTNAFHAANWGFATTVSNLPSGRRLVSVGTYGHATAKVTADAGQALTDRSIHVLYAHAILAGNSSRTTNYVLKIGGTGSQKDLVIGDVYSGGNLEVSGDAKLWMPEGFVDSDGNGIFDSDETRTDSGTTAVFSNALTQAQFNAYTSTVNRANLYPNGRFDTGEAFVDAVGNGVYDSGESFVDANGDGIFDGGDSFVDADGDGQFDVGESFVDYGNGQYNSGEAFEDLNNNGHWDAAQAGYWETVKKGKKTTQVWHDPVPAEPYEDRGNGQYDPGEPYTDHNGAYDAGDPYFDDRNGRYDYGAQATGSISGMPSPGPGQQAADGHDPQIVPPDLGVMYYDRPSTTQAPSGAGTEWGNDVDVAAAPFNSSGKITDVNNPSHIFVKNPSNHTYTKIPGQNDYFLEDPTDSSYTSGTTNQYLNVKSNGNNKVYFVDGNLYVHSPTALTFNFKTPGTKMTIVAKGNIVISDELRYNGGTTNPLDSVALIAMKDAGVTNSGNIYFGDATYGTGGDVHAMLYAENNFIDNNLGTVGQGTLSVFGNMTAGNQVNINRGLLRTRLDVRLDERIVDRRDLPPRLPQAISGQRSIAVTGAWAVVKGTWYTHSPLQ